MSTMSTGAVRKGQTFTADFFFSVVVFVFIINILYLATNNAQSNTADLESDLMQKKVFYITDTLVRTGGHPSDWNSTNVELPGLVESSNIIDLCKIAEFGNISNSNLTYMWGLVDYDFNLTIKSDTVYMTFGNDINMSSTFITPIERVVLIELSGNTYERGILTFTLWVR